MRLSTLVLLSLGVSLGWILRDATQPRSTPLATRSTPVAMPPAAPAPIVDAASLEESSDVQAEPTDPAVIDWHTARARIVARLNDDALRQAS